MSRGRFVLRSGVMGNVNIQSTSSSNSQFEFCEYTVQSESLTPHLKSAVLSQKNLKLIRNNQIQNVREVIHDQTEGFSGLRAGDQVHSHTRRSTLSSVH